jgi:hypothetical protein
MRAKRKPDTALLLSSLTSEQAQQVAEAFDTEAAVVEPVQIARDCVKRIRLADIEETMQGLREQAASEQISVEEKLRLTRRIQEMDNVRRNLRAQ